MDSTQLFAQIRQKGSFLCVGLDTDPQKLPACLQGTEDAMFAFNRAIIDATAPYTVAYKPNVAFYEAEGVEGWRTLERTVAYIRERYPEQFIIADAKRGDIGNTSSRYAAAFFGKMACDAVTVAPYMGEDSVKPFLKDYAGKWVILLALTSNKSAEDFQYIPDVQGEKLFERVIRTSQAWGSPENTMYVVGATRAEMLEDIRRIAPDHFLLVPGVGAQGGSLEAVARYGMNSRCGLLVNSSRGIIYADSSERFAETAGAKARETAEAMRLMLQARGLIS
jgi:orotidine-5'-phosphate decarboxylase